MLYRVHLAISGIGTRDVNDDISECAGSCKSSYHTIMTTTFPKYVCNNSSDDKGKRQINYKLETGTLFILLVFISYT